MLGAAEAAYENKRDAEAAAILRKLVREYPHNFVITETLGSIEAAQGHLQAALPLLQAACAADTSSPVALANLGAAYLKLRRNREAVEVLERAAAMDAGNAQTQSALGQAYLLTQQPKKAAGAFAEAVKAGGGDVDNLYNWALSLFQSGQAAAAGQVLAHIDESARTPQIESLMGDVDEAAGDFRGAEEHLQKAANADPSEERLNALGLEFLRHWTFDAAQKVYSYSLTKYPHSTRLAVGSGIADFGASRYPEAAHIFAPLMTEHPQQALYADLLGYACNAIRTAPSEDCLKLVNYAERHPGNTDVSTAAATLLMHDGGDEASLTRAREILRRAMGDHSKSAESCYAMGLLDQRERKWHQSIAMLEQAVRLRPEFPQAHYRLAMAYSHDGNEEKAHVEAALEKKYQQNEEHRIDSKMTSIFRFGIKQ